MNLRKKYIQAVKREINDYVPFYFGLTPPQMQKYQKRYGETPYPEQFSFPLRGVGPIYSGQDPAERYADYLQPWQDNKNLTTGIFGEVAIRVKDSHFTHKEAIMKDFAEIEDFERYPYLDPVSDFNWQQFNKNVEEIHRQNLAVGGELACTIFEIAWYLRGIEQLLIDMIENQQLLEYHLDRITEIRIEQAKKMAVADIDVLHLGDDIATQRGMMMQPDMWRKFFKTRLALVIKKAKEIKPDLLIKYHSDGNPAEVIDDLIEIGVDILNPIQPECIDPVAVKEKYGERLTLDGTLGTQSVFPFGTANEVKQQCILRIKKCGYNGGLVLAPSHVIEPEVPWENIEAFVDTVRKYNAGEITI